MNVDTNTGLVNFEETIEISEQSKLFIISEINKEKKILDKEIIRSFLKQTKVTLSLSLSIRTGELLTKTINGINLPIPITLNRKE